MAKTLKHKKIKGKMTVLKVMPYKEHLVYIRMLYGEYFEYIFEHKGELFSSYMIIKPRNGKTKLSNDDISQSAGLIWNGATATIDSLLDIKLSKEDQDKVTLFEQSIRNGTQEVKE